MEPSVGAHAASLCFALVAAIFGFLSLRKGKKSHWTIVLMTGAFIAQCAFLYFRGEMRGKCPLGDWGEILMFIAWSLTLFYMFIGPAYRVSLLGLFSTPLVSIMTGVALIPGLLESSPERITKGSVDAWGELHAALSVLSYGALALGMVAAVMFLVLDKQLKKQKLTGVLFKNMPPVFQLIALSKRLTWVGLVILTAGILSSFKMHNFSSNSPHLWTAVGVWVAYLGFLIWSEVIGMTPRSFAKCCGILFFASLVPFALI